MEKQYRYNPTTETFHIAWSDTNCGTGMLCDRQIMRAPWGYELMSFTHITQEWLNEHTVILPDDHEFVIVHKKDEEG